MQEILNQTKKKPLPNMGYSELKTYGDRLTTEEKDELEVIYT